MYIHTSFVSYHQYQILPVSSVKKASLPEPGTTWLLATIILLMVVLSKLFAIIASTHKSSFTSLMAIMLTSISRTVTISLSFVTRILRSAASSPLVVTTTAPLSCRGF
eukprot:GFUD01121656.1.p1 GENE.GFUD01121656.1~~GFUD01121656.1.p1  ORF type:complete len:108 (+),score=7.19 GFUD01121656.1:124-447(+)